MAEITAQEIAKKTGGKIIQGNPNYCFQKFGIDSRRTEQGELFVAIKGERDGHEFVEDALRKGARGAIVSKKINISQKDFILIKVKDTLEALHRLARSILNNHSLKVVGITGSIGKTTTKEFAFSLISDSFKVLKSEGNYNNQLGLPLTLLKLSREHEVAILEMAMNLPGEIRILTQIAPPDVAVITNINPVHLQYIGNIENIAWEKKQILEGAKENATAVLNGDDPLVQKIAQDWKGKKVTFGYSKLNDIRAEEIESKGFEGFTLNFICGKEKVKINLPFLYETYISNFLAASAIAHSLQVEFKDILSRTKSLKTFARRGVLFDLGENIKLIDDSYNSNPVALNSVLGSLARLPAKRKVAVLGDMLELGEKEIEYHKQAGKTLCLTGWDVLVTVGPLSRYMAQTALSLCMKKENVFSFEDSDEAAEKISILLKAGDLVLVKGSRGIKTEKIVDKLMGV